MLVFIPVLVLLYLALAVLEDSGYMARAAFVMDRLMAALGLHGKSFLPPLAAVFFPGNAGHVIVGLYLAGMVVAIGLGAAC